MASSASSPPSLVYRSREKAPQQLVAGAKPKANPLSFPKSSEPFSEHLFQNPTSEYRGCPLWAWNAKLDPAQLRRQIDAFKQMGLGGFHMHVRVGLDTEYMSDEFLDAIQSCVDYAEEKDMLACLYDDDRWPSGVVGGRLIQDYPEHKGKHILFTTVPYGIIGPAVGQAPSSAAAIRSENGYLLAKYSVTLDEGGNLVKAEPIGEDETAEGDTWYAYVESNPSSPWFNGQTYVDTLSKDAIAKFLDLTHEVYKEKVGDRFGATIPCSFTDEPQFATKTRLPNPQAKQDTFLPWTDDLQTTFKDKYGPEADLVGRLPELIWNLADRRPSLTRYQYHDHVCERFVSAYMDQVSEWCGKNDIMLNGHMMEEPTLYSQTTALGEAMRCYRNMQIPGIDLLNDSVEYNTAKQASSVARQRGVKTCGSETYGCTHWTFTFEGHKGCSDWQAALGITFRVPHLSWMSMAGEGKRDYPASINYQSPWYKEYGYIEDHFARVNVALTRGRPVTRVAVVHPIESYWLCFGPEGAGDEMQWRDQAFAELTDWLLHGLVDFDFISESMLPEQFGGFEDGKLKVGACAYDVVILPNLRTIRSTTFEIIVQGFARHGGDVVVAGQIPTLVDGKPPLDGFHAAFRGGNFITWDRDLVLSYLEPYKDLKVASSNTSATGQKLLYQVREDAGERYVFICNTDRNEPFEGTILLKGSWQVYVLDTLSGSQEWTKSWRNRDWTVFPRKLDGCASLLLRLTPAEGQLAEPAFEPSMSISSPAKSTGIVIKENGVSLSELNVLLLDQALYRVDDGGWTGPQEILQVDNDIRNKLRLPRKGSAWKQPWSIPTKERAPKAQLSLKLAFSSELDLESPTYLALELIDEVKITLNSQAVKTSKAPGTQGWWVDEAISLIKLDKGLVKKGANTLVLDFPFGVLTNIERIYLLGSFAVSVDGPKATIKPAPSAVTWGDITKQGLPFYAGNVEYQFEFNLENPARAVLSVPQFSSPVLRVDRLSPASGVWEKVGHIAIQPRTLSLGRLPAGTHVYRLTAFGNRFNSFGHVHLPDWVGGCWPDVWRSKEWAWIDGYNLKPIGVLEAPTILIIP